MKIITFCQVDETVFNPEFSVEYFHNTPLFLKYIKVCILSKYY